MKYFSSRNHNSYDLLESSARLDLAFRYIFKEDFYNYIDKSNGEVEAISNARSHVVIKNIKKIIDENPGFSKNIVSALYELTNFYPSDHSQSIKIDCAVLALLTVFNDTANMSEDPFGRFGLFGILNKISSSRWFYWADKYTSRLKMKFLN